MKKMLLLGLVFFAQITFGQNAESLKPILFLNETVGLNAENDGRISEFGNFRYVLVQHPELKIQSDFFGFQTLDYVPHNAAFARVAENQFESSKEAIENAGGRVLNLRDAWRLSKPLHTANYNEWAWAEDGQSLVLWIQYYRGISHYQVLQSLSLKGITILNDRAADRRFEVILDPERMEELLSLGAIQYIEERYAPGEPENYTAATNHRVNYLQQAAFNGGLNYDGSGIMVAHNDAGGITEHIDFKGRFSQNAGTAGSDHGDHTAGTISAAGNANPYGRGMAPGADMFYRAYPANLNDADNVYTSINARLTSNSFSNGCNGGYSTWSQQLDKDAYDNPNMLHVFSAGNNGSSSCAVDYGAGVGWGNITGGHKQAKNVVTVGNVTTTDGLAGSSSRGPASDGRIKPDLCAVGTQVFSTTDANGPNTYNSKTGTSMSCPGVTGTLAVLMEAYKDLNAGEEAHGSLLKGVLMNTTEDLGNAGPDYRFGYGRINARRAYEVLENGWFMEDSLSTGDSASFTFNIPANTAQARFLVIWPDREASPSAARDLVNDLDLEVDFSGQTYLPWVLNPTANVASLNSLAVRARDSLNNIEQVTLDNPSSGAATVTIHGTNVPTGGDQRFFVIAYYESTDLVVTYPVEGMGLPTGSSERIRFDAPQSTPHTAEYSLDGGGSWLTINTTANARQMTWVIPNVTNDQVYLRVRSAFDTVVVGPMTIVQVPGPLNIIAACPDSVHLDWNDVNGVSGYVVYKVGAKYMDSVAYVTSSEAWVAHNPNDVDWFAVASVVNDTNIGFRSNGVQKSPGVFNCAIPNDLELQAVLAPGQAELPDCVTGPDSDLPVYLIRNTGTTTISNFDLSFRRQGASAISTETFTGSLNPGDTMLYYFQSNRVNLLNNVSLTYEFWVDANDGNSFNDTIINTFRKTVSSEPVLSVPYSQDFEGFNSCSDNTNCEFTSCNLVEGWYNYQNQIGDFIDFRTWSGPTASSGTGPNFDFNPGTSSGKYLYLESSGGCDSAEAMVITPCISLDSVYRPHATIFYHMRGADHMGLLSVDVYDGRRWHLDVAAKISGDQGSSWLPLTADLSAFSGKTINIRYRAKTGGGFRSDIALDDFSIVDSSGVGISEDAWLSGLKLFPNPSNGRFTLATDDTENNMELKISDLNGALIWQANFEASNQSEMIIDLSDKAPGVYILQVSNDEYSSTFRMIKE
ncbi:MAG: S8 family serine peptidase [Bacteroidetes bacterium]|nr:S8 family serine peptidase [Bacteroidota bacterium]